MEPADQPASSPTMSTTQEGGTSIRAAALGALINNKFSLEEIRTLCHELEVDFENLAGETKMLKAQEFAAHLHRRNRLDALEAACRRLRPAAFQPAVVIQGQEIDAGNTTISPPTYTGSRLLEAASSWISEQGRYWDASIPAKQLVQSLQLFYLPYWVLNIRGSAAWSARIPKPGEMKTCTRCNGSGKEVTATMSQTCPACDGVGQIEDPATRGFTKLEGHVRKTLNRVLVPNFSETLKLDAPKTTVSTLPFSEERAAGGQLARFTTSQEEAQTRANDQLLAALEREAQAEANEQAKTVKQEKAEDLDLLNVVVEDHQVEEIWFYPVYIGTYEHLREHLAVQVDGITGKMYAELPQQIRAVKQRHADIGGSIFLLLLIGMPILCFIYFVLNFPR
jgi:hypothetical protein